MGLFVENTDDRSELQKRVAAEVSAKERRRRHDIDLEPQEIDGVDDSAYIEEYTQSKTLQLDKTWWILIGLVAAAVVVILVAALGGGK